MRTGLLCSEERQSLQCEHCDWRFSPFHLPSLGCRGKAQLCQLGQRNKGNMEIGAGDESLTLHFFKTSFRPFTRRLAFSLCSTQWNRNPQRKERPRFLSWWPGGSWRSLRVLAGDELSLRAEEGPFPLVRFLRSLKSRGKVSTLGRVSGKVRLRANICGLFCQGLWHPPGHRNEVKPHTSKPGTSSSDWGFLWVETHFQFVENSP